MDDLIFMQRTLELENFCILRTMVAQVACHLVASGKNLKRGYIMGIQERDWYREYYRDRNNGKEQVRQPIELPSTIRYADRYSTETPQPSVRDNEKSNISSSVWDNIWVAYIGYVFALFATVAISVFVKQFANGYDCLGNWGFNLTTYVVMSCIPAWSVMGWLRKYCHWIVALLFCVLAMKCGNLVENYIFFELFKFDRSTTGLFSNTVYWVTVVPFLVIFSSSSFRKKILFFIAKHSDAIQVTAIIGALVVNVGLVLLLSFFGSISLIVISLIFGIRSRSFFMRKSDF